MTATVQDASELRATADRLHVLVAAVDPGMVLPATAKDLVALGERIERSGRALKMLASVVVEESAVWKGEGDRSVEDWMARTTGSSRSQAARDVT